MNDAEPELFIDGCFRPAHAFTPVIEAATEKPLGSGPSATKNDVDHAVAAAGRALPGWKATPVRERADLLERLAATMEARADQTAELCSRETGSPIAYSRIINGLLPAAVFRYYAGLITTTDIEEIRPSAIGHTIVRREPVGVAAAIVPWNVPQVLAAMKIGPALAAGCTAVVKPAPETSLDARAFGEAAAEAGLPAGVLNVIAGGSDAGAYLVRHPGIDKVGFTGSTEVGRRIAETCGRLMRAATLELGGKSAAIILDDADLDVTIRGIRMAAFANNGQLCYANSRILAPSSRYAEVVDALAGTANSLIVGDPLDEAVEVGPLVSARQRDRVLSYVETGKIEGARLVCGGGAPAGQRRGWYVTPTVFAEVNNSARIAREEIFGPVVSVIAYGSDGDAVDIANDSEFGLGGTVWSSDETRATEVARALQTGTVGVNEYQLDLAAPFGGVKASGLGREFGPEGLAAYQTLKSIFRVAAPQISKESA